MAIYETPELPVFTDWVIKAGLLHEPLRLIDAGVQGGLKPRWKWLGEYLEAWGFDPLAESIEPLVAANPAPKRIHYYSIGLGNEDGERLFSRADHPYASAFLPYAIPESQLGRDGSGNLLGDWRQPTMRRLDTLFAEGLFGAVDYIKLDCEGFETEVLRGAQRVLAEAGVFAIEVESSLKLHPWHKPSHFAELQEILAPAGFEVYDLYFYRDSRQPFSGGFPHKGKPDTFDFLFLRGFGEEDELSAHSLDRLIKMAIVTELYGLQDVAANIVTRAATRFAMRFDPERAVKLLRQSWTGASVS